jgi:hypothetical protein
MNQEDLSPTVVAGQKAVSDHKQSTNIRKITIESIAPVIKKSVLYYQDCKSTLHSY